MKSFPILLACLCASLPQLSLAQNTSTTLVQRGASWKYLDKGSDQGTNWREKWFSDTTWAGPSPAKLGYGEGDEATVVGFGPDANNKYVTTYFRGVFTVANPSAISALNASLLRDDGAVVYINGQEVIRDNMPAGTIIFNTFASSPEVSGTAEDTFNPHTLSPAVLRPGTNTIAVEVHQQRGSSSDLSFNMDLVSTFPNPVGNTPTVTLNNPANNATFINPSSITFTASATDTVGSIALVEFYRGTTKIGETATAPFSVTWTTPWDGRHAITAIATDNNGNKTISTPSFITVSENQNVGPVVNITQPLPNSDFSSPATFTFTVIAEDANGVVEKVEFFNGTTKIGEDTTAPYSIPVSNLFSGSSTFIARATDDGGETTSAKIEVLVTNENNVGPAVSITSPANLASISSTVVTINATSSDTDGFLTKLEFFQGSTKIGEDTTAPYSLTWSGVAPGTYSLTAVATDNDGGLTTSAPVSITVTASLNLSYSENFNAMGTGAAAPAGWTIHGALEGSNITWTNAIGTPSSGSPSAATPGSTNPTLIVTSNAATGTINSNTQAYNAALSDSTSDRALATAPTSGARIILQLALANTSGGGISAVDISYDILRFRVVTPATAANELPGYRLFYSLDSGITWTNVSALNPTLSTAGTIQVPNTAGVTSITSHSIVLASAWNSGGSIHFRWVDDNADQSSPDQFTGLDNVSIVATQFITGTPPTTSITSPANTSTFSNLSNITINANGSDPDGTVTKIEFFQGATKLGEDTTAPYSFAWNTFAAGTYILNTRATDNNNNIGTSTPVTVTVNPPPGIVAGPWSGNISHDRASISVALTGSGISTRARLSTSSALTDPIYSSTVVSQSSAGNSVRLEVTGLNALTTYFYAIEIDGTLQTSGDLAGKFSTFPVPGPASFRFAFASCGSYSNASQFVYESIVNDNPLFFIHMGDMNYQDIDSTDPNNYRTVYNAQINTGQLRRVCRAMGMAYMWDDHDYSGNDSNRTNIGRAASRQVYRERFPHYATPAGNGDNAIYQTFSVGRVKYILTDLRSERDPIGNTDNASKTHLGIEQKAWFKQRLLDARDSETPLIVWNSSVPFISSNTSGDDWGRFQTERRELLEFIRDNRIQNVCVISGDMHALALDDGAGSSSYVAGVRLPIFHGAALAQSGSSKGGPYRVGGNTVPPNTGLGRYGIIDVADNGSSVTATFRGRIANGSGSTYFNTADWSFLTNQSAYVFNTEPVRPRRVTGLIIGNIPGGLTLSWIDNSSAESGHRVQRRAVGSPTWNTIATLGASIQNYDDTTVQIGVNTEYQIIAANSTIDADASVAANGTASTPPPTKATLTSSASPTSLHTPSTSTSPASPPKACQFSKRDPAPAAAR